MQIFPAIDIRDGRCVRLRQGDYAQETVFEDNPAVAAKRWVDEGATFLHLVDLDGAKDGRPINVDAVKAIVAAVDVPCQIGGGIRTDDDAATLLSLGVNRVIIGTKAVQEPDWLRALAESHPGRIALGIDAKNGLVATAGWLDVSQKPALELAQEYSTWPLAALIYTDISKDGMMQGPNFDAMKEMSDAVDLPVIASGGVTTADDVHRLRELGLDGCIIGRALYEGTIKLRDVLTEPRP